MRARIAALCLFSAPSLALAQMGGMGGGMGGMGGMGGAPPARGPTEDLIPEVDAEYAADAQKAFDLLVDHVEGSAPLPPSQCIPTNGVIVANPAQPGHCSQLFVP